MPVCAGGMCRENIKFKGGTHMKKNYAYIDKGGILHVVESRKTAEQYTTGKVVETEVPCEHGYPLHGGKDVTMYSLDTAYIGGNGRHPRNCGPVQGLYVSLHTNQQGPLAGACLGERRNRWPK